MHKTDTPGFPLCLFCDMFFCQIHFNISYICGTYMDSIHAHMMENQHKSRRNRDFGQVGLYKIGGSDERDRI